MPEWTPELALNHALLDEQHAEIFKRLAEAAAIADGAPAALDAAVAAVADALVVHLAAEERIMDDTLYPERVRHRSAHELFMADFLQMREELRTQGPTPAVADWLRRRIPEWLSFHIRVNDLPLGAYLARHPASPGDARTGRHVS